MTKREVRIRQIPDRFDGRKWHNRPHPIVRLGDVGKWSMVRAADYPNGCPFVISRKDWDKLAIVDTHRMAETENTGSVRSMSGDGAGTAIARKPAMTHTNLIERLNAGVTWSDGSRIGAVVGEVNDPVMAEAAQAISTLTAEVEELRAAGKRVIDGLERRIDEADPGGVPVFDGIAELHDAIFRTILTKGEGDKP